MRILIICSHYPPTSSPEAIHGQMLCEHLAAEGDEVHLLTSPLLPGAPKARQFVIHPDIPRWDWVGRRDVIRSIKRIQPEVILLIYVGWIYGNHPMITFAPAFLRRAGIRTPFITQFENCLGATVIGWKGKARWLAAKWQFGGGDARFGTLLGKSSALITLCDQHRADLIAVEKRAERKITVIPVPPLLRVRSNANNVARNDGRKKLGIAEGIPTFVLVFMGYVYPGKGIETLLQAAALIKTGAFIKGGGQLKVVVIGQVVAALESKLQTLVEELSLSEMVIWLGHKESEECSTYLWAGDAAVLPFDEGLRLNNSSFAVCVAHLLPVISTRGPNLEGALNEPNKILLVMPKDPAALATAIEEVMRLDDLRQRLIQGSSDLAANVASWNIAVQATRKALGADRPLGDKMSRASSYSWNVE